MYVPIAPGDYLMERWDTYTGEVVGTNRTGEVRGALHAKICREGLILWIGDIETDVAIKIIRQPSGNSTLAPAE